MSEGLGWLSERMLGSASEDAGNLPAPSRWPQDPQAGRFDSSPASTVEVVNIALVQDALRKLREAQALVKYAGDLANMGINHGSWISFRQAELEIENEIEKLREILKAEEARALEQKPSNEGRIEVHGVCSMCGKPVPPGFYPCSGDGSHPAAHESRIR